MKLTDIGKITSKSLNETLQENAGWCIRLNKLSLKSARTMMESIDQKLLAVKKSSQVHTSERDPNYVNMLMAKNVLETFIKEAKKAKPGIEKRDAEESVGKKTFKVHVTYDDPKGKVASKTVTIPDAENVKHAKKLCKEKHCKNLKNVKIGKTTEVVTENIISRRRLLEDELSQAQSMLAAKDMVDSIQDMIEEISRMQNEQLPPLGDSIRASYGPTESDEFKNSATSTLQSLLGNLQTARDGMDQAVRILSGEQIEKPGGGSMNDFDMDAGMDDQDDFAATEPAKGGKLPMGREKR